ncbi:MAG: hypothetical protein ABL958_14800 [Bdellovibrionia bacterium]
MSKIIGIMIAGAIVLAAELALSATCAEQGRVIQQDLNLVLGGTNATMQETRPLDSNNSIVRQISDQLQVGNVDLNGATSQDLRTLAEQVLQARQALYNVNVLLEEIKASGEATGGIKAIADNAVVNNLNPARQRLDRAQTGVEGLQRKVGDLHTRIQQILRPVQNASQSLYRVSGALSTSSSRIYNLSSRASTDTDRAFRRIDELVRTCQGIR